MAIAGFYGNKKIEIKDIYDVSIDEYATIEQHTRRMQDDEYLSQDDINKNNTIILCAITGEPQTFIDGLDAIELISLLSQANNVLDLKHLTNEERSQKQIEQKAMMFNIEKTRKFTVQGKVFDLLEPSRLSVVAYASIEKMIQGYSYYDEDGELKIVSSIIKSQKEIIDGVEKTKDSINLKFAPYLLALFSLEDKYKGSHINLHPISNVYTYEIHKKEISDYIENNTELFKNANAQLVIALLNFFLANIQSIQKNGESSLIQKIKKLGMIGAWQTATQMQLIS